MRESKKREKKMSDKKKNWFVSSILVIAFLFCSVAGVAAEEKKRVIVIDPAHGGKETGLKLNDEVAEKDITLAVALMIRKELASEKNITVVLTRDADKKVDLAERKKIIEKNSPDCVLSLHVNGGFGKEASGFEVYYPECGSGALEEEKKAQSFLTAPQKKCRNDSLKMAKIVQDHFNILFPRKGRGMRKADLPVTDGLFVPAVSVEMGFATNPDEKKKLLSAKTQADIARTLANSIKTFSR